jgi:hypothetical protein
MLLTGDCLATALSEKARRYGELILDDMTFRMR